MASQDEIKKIEARLTALEQDEQRIEAEEKEILSADQHILDNLERNRTNNAFVKILYRFRFLVSIMLTVGVVLIWKGVGDLANTLPIVSTAAGALIFGLTILLLIDWLTRVRR